MRGKLNMSVKTTIEFEAQDENDAVVRVAGTFRNQWGDLRAIIVGDTYEVMMEGDVRNDLDWDITHHSWEDPLPYIAAEKVNVEKAYLIDANDESLDHFEAAVEAAGFEFERDSSSALGQLAEMVESRKKEWDCDNDECKIINSGDDIVITYKQSKGDWDEATVEGTVVEASVEDEYVNINRSDDGHFMEVKPDDNGSPALFTGYSQYPYMGPVVKVEIIGQKE